MACFLTRSVDLFFKTAISSSPKITIPPKVLRIVCCNFFFRRDYKLQTYHENFLSMDNKYRKLFVIKQSKGCKFMPKIRLNKFGSRAPPGAAGRGAYALFQAPGVPISKRRKERGGCLLLSGTVKM